MDVGLSQVGEEEAKRSAEALKNSGIKITKIFTSILRRAILTVEKIVKVQRVDYMRGLRGCFRRLDWRTREL